MGHFAIFCRRALMGLLACTAASAAGEVLALRTPVLDAAPYDSLLATQYRQSGDELIRDDQAEQAADAYERALSLGAQLFPMAERIRIAQHLAAVGRLDSAIDALREVLREQPDHVDARVDLARYLSWNNELLAAVSEAEEVLRKDPGNRAALQVKADASSWRGDFGTALPIYRRLLSDKEAFDIRLNYTHGLVGAGQIEPASESRARLTAGSARQEQLLAALDRRIDRGRSRRLMAGGSYYNDSDHNRRHEYRLGGGASIANLDLTAEAEQVQVRGTPRSVDVDRLRMAVTWPATDWLNVRAGVGVAVVDGAAEDTYPIGFVGGDGVNGRVRVRADLERDVLDDTALILSNRIRKTRAHLFASFQLDDRWRFDADTEYEDFSDDNDGWKAELTPQYTVGLGKVGLRVGYRHVEAGFDHQSGGGYFDPSHLQADYLVVVVSRFGDRVHGAVEVYGGRQTAERFGIRQRDDVIGGTGRLAVEIGRHFRIESELEGGNFSLQTPGGFSYSLVSVNLIGLF